MNIYLFIAGLLCFLLGVVHSALGEVLIFKRYRNQGSIIPSNGNLGLRKRHLRIIWATWHLASLFGFGFGGLLITYSKFVDKFHSEMAPTILTIIAITMLFSGALVFVATKGKHPGFIVLWAIGLLVFYSGV